MVVVVVDVCVCCVCVVAGVVVCVNCVVGYHKWLYSLILCGTIHGYSCFKNAN